MSHLKWSDHDTLRLIQWVAGECLAALKAGDSATAAALMKHTASFIALGDMSMGRNQRVNAWLNMRLSLIFSALPIGVDKTSRCDRDQIFESLRRLHEFWEKCPEMVSLDASEDDVWLPESFDAKIC
jgi:hypothetical protein